MLGGIVLPGSAVRASKGPDRRANDPFEAVLAVPNFSFCGRLRYPRENWVADRVRTDFHAERGKIANLPLIHHRRARNGDSGAIGNRLGAARALTWLEILELP